MRLPNDTQSITDYAKIKVGIKSLEDAVLNISGTIKQSNPNLADKAKILQAIAKCDITFLRQVSRHFNRVSGIYQRLVRHLANFYRYDWVLTPHTFSKKVDNEKITSTFEKILFYLDNSQIKKFLGKVAEQVVIDGVYYGYIIDNEISAAVQELDPKYCRSRMSVNGEPAVEFNMKFFVDYYKDIDYRHRVLGLMPKDFQKGYLLYMDGKLVPDYPGDQSGWYLLDPNYAVKFSLNDDDYPVFASVIPYILDLDMAQELDRKKMAQKLLKIIIQKLPTDKNGDLIFDVDEAQELHNNAVKMLGQAIGIDVLTTFADIDVADMADNSSVTSIDELDKVERSVFNESGTAQNLFNTDGNLALEKSILDDEASIYNLLLQFESFLNKLIKPHNKNPKKVFYRVSMLPTTIYNYKEMAKLYKEQVALGYSKVLPAIALGQSQSQVIAIAKFENKVLDLVSIFTPPQNANTMSSNPQKADNGANGQTEEKKAGRQEKPDDEKSEKTIANKEAMS